MNISRNFLSCTFVFLILFGGLILSLLIPGFGENGGSSVSGLAFIALSIFLLVFINMRGGSSTQFSPLLIGSLLLFIICCFGSIFLSFDPDSAILGTLELILGIAAFYTCARLTNEEPDILTSLSLCIVEGTPFFRQQF